MGIEKGYNSNELFPLGFPIYDPVEVNCSNCGTKHTNSQKSVDKMSKLGKGVFCNSCHKEFKLKSLVRQSAESKRTIINASPTSNNRHNMNSSYNPKYSAKLNSGGNGGGGIYYGNKTNTSNKTNYNSKKSNYSGKNTSSASGLGIFFAVLLVLIGIGMIIKGNGFFGIILIFVGLGLFKKN